MTLNSVGYVGFSRMICLIETLKLASGWNYRFINLNFLHKVIYLKVGLLNFWTNTTVSSLQQSFLLPWRPNDTPPMCPRDSAIPLTHKSNGVVPSDFYYSYAKPWVMNITLWDTHKIGGIKKLIYLEYKRLIYLIMSKLCILIDHLIVSEKWYQNSH